MNIIKHDDIWHDVNKELPHPALHKTNTIGYYLVTLASFYQDKEEVDDDREIAIATFCYNTMTWRYACDYSVPYDNNMPDGWRVMAWKPLPTAFTG